MAERFNEGRRPGIEQLTAASSFAANLYEATEEGATAVDEKDIEAHADGDAADDTIVHEVALAGVAAPLAIRCAAAAVSGTGGTVWPAGSALATWLSEQMDAATPEVDVRAVRSALELGSGTGACC